MHHSSDRFFIPSGEDASTSSTKREDARTSMQQPPSSTARVGIPPPFGVPSRDGSFGVSTLKGPVSLGWSLLTLGASTWVFGSALFGSSPLPSIPILREGSCPASGSAPSPPLKVQPPLPPGPPYKLPIQGAGPRRCGGWYLSVVAWCLWLSRCCFGSGSRAPRGWRFASGENSVPSHFDQDTGFLGGSGGRCFVWIFLCGWA